MRREQRREGHGRRIGVHAVHVEMDRMQRVVGVDLFDGESVAGLDFAHLHLPFLVPVEDVDQHGVVRARTVVAVGVLREEFGADRPEIVLDVGAIFVARDEAAVEVVGAELIVGCLADALIMPLHVVRSGGSDLEESVAGRCAVAAHLGAAVGVVARPPRCGAYGGDIVFGHALGDAVGVVDMGMARHEMDGVGSDFVISFYFVFSCSIFSCKSAMALWLFLMVSHCFSKGGSGISLYCSK